jgi:hypothetical protein
MAKKNDIIKDIKDNPKLLKFCNRILSLNTILENEEFRNMYIVSLISADQLTDEYDCDNTISEAEFILNNIDLFELNGDIKNKLINYMETAINIATREKKEFLNQKKTGLMKTLSNKIKKCFKI